MAESQGRRPGARGVLARGLRSALEPHPGRPLGLVPAARPGEDRESGPERPLYRDLYRRRTQRRIRAPCEQRDEPLHPV